MKSCSQCQSKFPDDVDFCPNDGMKLRRASTDEDPLIDRILDRRWVVEEKIGEGGMGSVYRGYQTSVKRPIAIKTLRKSLVDSDEFVDRFFREAKIASNINHPNCVTIYDYGHTEDDVLFIVMEFLDGKPLSDLADEGSLTLESILEIACDTTRALAAAHTFNVVHRDLKPDNIFVVDVPGGGKNAKVLDFGIAKALDAEESMTRTGVIFGTPEYMSPEQCAGLDIDPRSDLYSLGCILYELVGGKTPFRATTPMAVLMAHVNETAPNLEQTGKLPSGVESIIFKLLEKKPEDRYESANVLLEFLEAELQTLRNGGDQGELTRPTSKDTSPVAFDSTVAMPESGPQVATVSRDPTYVRDEKSSRSGLVAIAVVIVLLVAGAGVTAFVMSGETDESVAAETESKRDEERAEGKPDEVEPIAENADHSDERRAHEEAPDRDTAPSDGELTGETTANGPAVPKADVDIDAKTATAEKPPTKPARTSTKKTTKTDAAPVAKTVPVQAPAVDPAKENAAKPEAAKTEEKKTETAKNEPKKVEPPAKSTPKKTTPEKTTDRQFDEQMEGLFD